MLLDINAVLQQLMFWKRTWENSWLVINVSLEINWSLKQKSVQQQSYIWWLHGWSHCRKTNTENFIHTC